MAQAQIINIEDKRSRQPDTTAWYGNVDLGFNVYENNGAVYTLKGGLLLEFQRRKNLYLIVNQFNLVKASGANFVNDGFQHVRYNYNLRPRVVYEAFAQAQYNERVRIRFRGLLGTGLRFQIFEEQPIFFGTSYMYEYEEESKSEGIRRGHRWSSYLSFRYGPTDNFLLANTSYFQPLFDQFNDFRLSSQTSILLRVSDRLNFKSSFSITFDTQVPEGVPSTIYRFNNGIRWIIR
ncbi:MAG: DUF481 domain-containing protein [Bacteroidota bacterium]